MQARLGCLVWQLQTLVLWCAGPTQHYKLVGGTSGEKKAAWQITRGKRSLDTRLMRDAVAKQERMTGVYWTPVEPPDWPGRLLYLVVARSGKAGAEPWYLLTSEKVATASDAWRIVSAYARRWQIEMSFRYNKSELALQSPRLWTRQRRVKLMMIVTVASLWLAAQPAGQQARSAQGSAAESLLPTNRKAEQANARSALQTQGCSRNPDDQRTPTPNR